MTYDSGEPYDSGLSYDYDGVTRAFVSTSDSEAYVVTASDASVTECNGE